MTPKTYLQTKSKAQIQQLCKRAGTTSTNFRLIALHKGACGGKLAVRLSDASDGEMSIREIIMGDKNGS